MPNWCGVTLVVTGPAKQVHRFIRTARGTPPRSPSRPGKPKPRAPVLAFTTLIPLERGPVDREALIDQYGTPTLEPEEPWRDPPKKVGRDLLRVTYGFQTRWAPPDLWVIRFSERFPEVCFVLGWVEPNMDMAGSLLTGRGPTREYEMGSRRKSQIYRKHRRHWAQAVRAGEVPASDDIELEADFDGDIEVMDLLIAHWEPTVRRRLGL